MCEILGTFGFVFVYETQQCENPLRKPDKVNHWKMKINFALQIDIKFSETDVVIEKFVKNIFSKKCVIQVALEFRLCYFIATFIFYFL